MSLEFENAISIQPLENSGSGLQFQNTIYIQPKGEGGDTPVIEDVGVMYQSVSTNGTTFGTYSEMMTNTVAELAELRPFSSSDTGLLNYWDYTGVLSLTVKFTYRNDVNSAWYNNPFIIIYANGDGNYYSATVHVENNQLHLAYVGAPAKQLTANHTYTMKLSLNADTNKVLLYCKEEGVDSDFVLIDTRTATSSSSATRAYIYISNVLSEGWQKPYHKFADFDLSDITIDIDGEVIFSRAKKESEDIVPTLFNMQYNGADTGLYSSNSTSACQYLSSSSGGKIDFKQRSGQTLTASNLYDIGYIDIPYTLGRLITVCQLDTSLTSSHPIRSIVFGKINSQGNFVPILYSDNSSSTETLTIGITTDDNISSVVGIGGSHYTTSQTWDASQTSNTVHKTDGVPSTTTYGGYIRLYETVNGIQLLAYDGGAYRTAGYTDVFINSKSITDSTLVARIKEITMARIIPAQYMGIRESTAISKAGIGLFDSDITSFNDFATTKYTFADIGENLLKWST